MKTHRQKLLAKFKCNLITWFIVKFPKIFLIFIIGFTTRFIINYYLDVNVFLDYMNLTSILYYLNFSWFIVRFNFYSYKTILANHITNPSRSIFRSSWKIAVTYCKRQLGGKINRCLIKPFIFPRIGGGKIKREWKGLTPLE